MREIIAGIELARRRVGILKGRNILMKVNLGRNKIIEFEGNIENLYPAIFTVRAKTEEGDALMSYSYNDVLTKNVRFFPVSE